MEDFAAQIADAGTSESVAQVYDQYLNFIVGEPDLFSLGMGKNTYWALNSAQTKDDELDAVIERIVSGLFSVVVTMGELGSHIRETYAYAKFRSNTNNSMPTRRGRGDDCCQARSQAERSHTEFEGKSVFQPGATTDRSGRNSFIAACASHCRP